MWKSQLGTSYLPYIKFTCIFKWLSYPLINLHFAHFKDLTKVTVCSCPVIEPNNLIQVYQKLHSYLTVEPNKLIQVYSCPDIEPNKLLQVNQLLTRMKCGEQDKVPNILSFSRASSMVHIGSGEILKRIFLGSAMSQHPCVPGRTPVISHGAGGSAGLVDVSLSLYSWHTHTLLPLMYIQALLYLLQVLIFTITAQ